MRCPYCGFRESKVVDSRPADEGSSIRRRWECLSCEKRFTTYETVESLPMVVIKKDGSRQSFDRSKILRGIQRSCEKRPVPVADRNAWPVRSSRRCRTLWSGRSAPRSSARRCRPRADEPAAPGTGVIAGGPVRIIMEAAGVKDIRTKCLRSNTAVNVVAATFEGLKALRTPEEVARTRGKSVDEIVG